MILQGFTLSIPAGKTVALVDNHNIKDLDLKCLCQNIGAVSQEPSLFAGTIKDNLKVGNMDADDQQIENAAMMANAHNFISHLPDKYLTEVGAKGLPAVRRTKQRGAIARAIIKNPPILLLDEATSALDSESEKLVQEALEKAVRGRTVILIAHRLSTIINADEIAVVETGQVKETEMHSTLLDNSKFYNSLFSMQNISVVRDERLAAS
ncbi:hypothetical protein EUGRSUZ_K00501 [Eucalyptus grandis]|uniref:Uncharacterized protein n=2 Tax=Eucalyptus grandis TaxID=71139 RepID=A0ACC3IQE7_EUCGR|nr:hypothetical protein EUGRSUZ_K00501 [Eucalyptus grandis]